MKSLKAIAAVAITSALGIGAPQTPDAQQPQQTQQTQQPQGQQAQQAGPKKDWKDRAEYDLYEAARKETNPDAKVKILGEWSTKYPNSDFKLERLQLFLVAYQQLAPARPADALPRIISTSKEILDIDPKNVAALFAIVQYSTTFPKPTPDDIGTADKAANALLSILDEAFAPAKKPETISEADWKKGRAAAEALAFRAQGWAAMQRKENEAAEKAFVNSLKVNPEQGEVSYWLGTVILAQKKLERQSEALYHVTRAASFDGPGALPAQQRQALDAYVTRSYTDHHGSQNGLPELRQMAKTQPFPPADFKILSAEEVAARRDEQLAKENPSLAFWLKLKDALAAPEGQQYFDTGMKGALVPPEGTPALRGKVVAQQGTRGVKEVKLAVSDPNTPEVTLELDTPLPNKAEPGTEIAFRGVAESFTKDPFNVTFKVEKSQITGWPAPPAPAKRAPRRPAAGKK